MTAKTLTRWRDIALATAAFGTVLCLVFLPGMEGSATRSGGSSAVVATDLPRDDATRFALNASVSANEAR